MESSESVHNNMNFSNLLFLDTEAYYDQDISIKTRGAYHYLRSTDIYMLSAVSDEINWVGRPEEFDWSLIHGKTLWFHNASFDVRALNRLRELGVIPAQYREVGNQCSANMAAYFGVPRSLDNASRFLLGKKIDKSVRANMKGRRPEDLNPEEYEALRQYALSDSQIGWELVKRYLPQWPEAEQRFSAQTIRMCVAGLPVDSQRLAEYEQSLEEQKSTALNLLPWTTEGFKPLSKAGFDHECRKHEVEPPKSLAMTDEKTEVWFDEHSEHFPFAKAMRDVRRINMLLTKVQAMQQRTDENGTFHFDLLYYGASVTGRDSGAGGINLQNLSRTPLYGVDLRSVIIAPPGKKIIAVDLAQIEARVLLALVRDHQQLDLVRSGISIYQAYAQTKFGWVGESLKKEDPIFYALNKMIVLSLGYSASFLKFYWMCAIQGMTDFFNKEVSQSQVMMCEEHIMSYAKDPTAKVRWKTRDKRLETHLTNAYLIVQQYRRDNPLIVKFWKKLHQLLQGCHGEDLELVLPSGRKLRWRDIRVTDDTTSGIVCSNGRFTREFLYGGKLVAAVTQGTARDVFRDGCIRLEDRGYNPRLRIHDEALTLEDQSTDPKTLEEIMSEPVPWLKLLPVGAEAAEMERYTK